MIRQAPAPAAMAQKKTEKVPKPARRQPLDLAMASDYELLQAFARKDSHEAFETLVTRHRRQVYNFIFGMVGRAEPAEDLFQETFLRVLKNADTYTPRAKFTTWCLQIARNLTLDYYKRESLRQHASLDASPGGDEEGSFAALLAGRDPRSDEILLSAELVAEVRAQIQRLPAHQREALVLRIYEDMPYADIAEVLGSPEGTVKYWVHEAIACLSRQLERRGLK